MPAFDKAVFAFVCLVFSTLSVANEGDKQRWPSHPVPTRTADVAAYNRAIKLRPSLEQCLKNEGGTTPGMRDCLNNEHAYQDERLNKSYQKLMSMLGEVDRRSLRNEEKAWISFRDEYCALDPEPGQAQELDQLECLVDQTADRATELESRIAVRAP